MSPRYAARCFVNWQTPFPLNVPSLQAYEKHAAPMVDLVEFVDHELVQYAEADNIRSIPNVYDGLKPSQRKVCVKSCTRATLHGWC